MNVERQLVEHGKVSRGRLGIAVQDVNADLAETFGMGNPGGAVVASVEVGSPAEKSGLQPGDVVIAFDGTPINRSGELPPLVADVAPGTKVDVTVWRLGKTHVVSVTVGELKDSQKSAHAPADPEIGKLGLSVRPLTPQERREARVVSGLLVEAVNDGPADRAGIQIGDVILSVNGQLIANEEQLRAKVGAADKRLSVLVQRDNSRILLPIVLG